MQPLSWYLLIIDEECWEVGGTTLGTGIMDLNGAVLLTAPFDYIDNHQAMQNQQYVRLTIRSLILAWHGIL